MNRISFYQRAIQKTLAYTGYIGRYDARHVEGWMRCESGCLDSLSPRKFTSEIAMARAVIDSAGIETSEKLAVSYGL